MVWMMKEVFVLYLLPDILPVWHLMVNEDTHHLHFVFRSCLVRYHSHALLHRHFSFLRLQIFQHRITSPQIVRSHPMLQVLLTVCRFCYVMMGSDELKWVSIETRQRTTLPSRDGRRRKEKIIANQPHPSPKSNPCQYTSPPSRPCVLAFTSCPNALQCCYQKDPSRCNSH